MVLVGREMRSKIDRDGRLAISLETVEIPLPGKDEVIVRVEAAPINPSDLGLLLGPADLSSLIETGTVIDPSLSLTVPAPRIGAVRGRLDQSLPIGNEGAGTVVATGRNAVDLQGQLVAMIGGAMYADYRCIDRSNIIALPEGASAADGAAMFVNPLTALGFIETARQGGHRAIVHTAAASNLGQMLQRLCLADGIELINIVRSQEQSDILKAVGAIHILNSTEDGFVEKLTEFMVRTQATIAFDATGGGKLGSIILQAMERAAVQQMPEYNRYGSEVFKHLYLYGALDLSPTVLNRLAFGYEWSVSGWLLFSFLRRAGPEVEKRLRARVAAELSTTFASRYTKTIGLAEALQSDVLKAYERKSTGEKYLIDPTKG